MHDQVDLVRETVPCRPVQPETILAHVSGEHFQVCRSQVSVVASQVGVAGVECRVQSAPGRGGVGAAHDADQ